MEFIKEESKDVKIEETFNIKHKDTEEQTDLVVLKSETGVKNEMKEEEIKKENYENPDSINNGKSFSCPPTETGKGTKTTRGKRKFGCHECGKIFHSDANLKAHLRIHAGERPFTCNQCGKSFTQSGNLKFHMKIHTGEKPFTCPQCGKSFSHKGALNVHIKTHTEKKLSVCPLCGKIYKSLKCHMIIHEGEKPFTCQQCGKSFKRQGALNTHMKIHNTKSHLHVRQIMPKNHLGITGVNLFAIDLECVSSAQNE